jgi:hypothetical protein
LWLASIFPNGHANLLTSPAAALARIGKPEVEAHAGLPVRIPTFMSTDRSDWDLHAFCRKHDWRVWLKGPYYDAVRTRTWDAFEAVRYGLSKVWNTDRLFLQAHVAGYEESVMFCAYRGELLGSVRMRKREITEEGKTWAGDVGEVDESFLAPLRRIIREVDWTGGGELEMVRDAEGQLWLLEWNPRFPAWVHGATIAGTNLPALLARARHRRSLATAGGAGRGVHPRRAGSPGALALSPAAAAGAARRRDRPLAQASVRAAGSGRAPAQAEPG